MTDVRRVRLEDWQALRDTRLRALADAPDAFATRVEDARERADAWSMWTNALFLQVLEGNDGAHSLYRACGFEDDGAGELHDHRPTFQMRLAP